MSNTTTDGSDFGIGAQGSGETLDEAFEDALARLRKNASAEHPAIATNDRFYACDPPQHWSDRLTVTALPVARVWADFRAFNAAVLADFGPDLESDDAE